MKLMLTIFNPPKQPIIQTTDISGLDAVKTMTGEGITRFVRAELLARGFSYTTMSDGRMIKLEVKK